MDPETRHIWRERIRQMRAFSPNTTQYSTMDPETRSIWNQRIQRMEAAGEENVEYVEEREGYLECLYQDIAQEPFEFNYEAAMGLGNIVRRRDDEEERRRWVTRHTRMVTLRYRGMAGLRARIAEESDEDSDDDSDGSLMDEYSLHRWRQDQAWAMRAHPERSEIFEPGEMLDWNDIVGRVEELESDTTEMMLSPEQLEDAIERLSRRIHGPDSTVQEVEAGERIEEAGLEAREGLENEGVEMDEGVTPQSGSGSSH
ncbi:hypothetical protein CKM354_000901000 [Cercospora kikuchii]|uniref:Uncharacterized protein n=1 Tax=Cercospora kikuchii TaxID=84275 RepID=A0A9P3CNT3_9PEZI|nr:uncharacterized protein CKM354_000901000 [Cercospora kikuchii]GIZ45861.1 hypothetical protein CKM354_000901000 [Cercospora kikuchii]